MKKLTSPTSVALKVKKRTALRANVDPNATDFNWKVKGQRKQGRTWATKFTATTTGTEETLSRNVGRGTWRVVQVTSCT